MTGPREKQGRFWTKTEMQLFFYCIAVFAPLAFCGVALSCPDSGGHKTPGVAGAGITVYTDRTGG
jgi:hypothetical protein